MQNRLITFGCSYTYGHGLPDCFVPPVNPGSKPSNMAWPSLIAGKIKLDLINFSKCGSSNLEILYNLLTFDFKNTDLIIVMWSFSDRDMLFQNSEKISIGAWQDTNLVKRWALVHCKEDMAVRSWLYIHHASLYLKSKNLKFYNVFNNYHTLKNFQPDFIQLDSPPFDMSEKLDYALDNIHPGPLTHKNLADNMLKEIRICK